jgi:hypothetical protein
VLTGSSFEIRHTMSPRMPVIARHRFDQLMTSTPPAVAAWAMPRQRQADRPSPGGSPRQRTAPVRILDDVNRHDHVARLAIGERRDAGDNDAEAEVAHLLGSAGREVDPGVRATASDQPTLTGTALDHAMRCGRRGSRGLQSLRPRTRVASSPRSRRCSFPGDDLDRHPLWFPGGRAGVVDLDVSKSAASTDNVHSLIDEPGWLIASPSIYARFLEVDLDAIPAQLRDEAIRLRTMYGELTSQPTVAAFNQGPGPAVLLLELAP